MRSTKRSSRKTFKSVLYTPWKDYKSYGGRRAGTNMVVNRPFSHKRSLSAVVNYSGYKSYVTSVEGVITEFQFGGNCLYDPDLSLGGHQPRGFDTYVQMYRKYYVRKCTATVHAMEADNSGGFIDGVAVFFNSDVAVVGTIADVAELQEITRINGGAFDIIGTNVGTSSMRKFTVACTPSMLFHKGFADPNMSGNQAENPRDKAVLHIVTYNTKGSSHNMKIIVELMFDVVFYDPIDPVYSA